MVPSCGRARSACCTSTANVVLVPLPVGPQAMTSPVRQVDERLELRWQMQLRERRRF